jgi:hypothetical protein
MELDPIIRTALALVALVALLTVVRMATVPDGVSLMDLFGAYREPEWPRGVQEEEPVRWRPECLTRPAKGDPRPRSSAPNPARDADQRLIEA